MKWHWLLSCISVKFKIRCNVGSSNFTASMLLRGYYSWMRDEIHRRWLDWMMTYWTERWVQPHTISYLHVIAVSSMLFSLLKYKIISDYILFLPLIYFICRNIHTKPYLWVTIISLFNFTAICYPQHSFYLEVVQYTYIQYTCTGAFSQPVNWLPTNDIYR